MVTRLDAVVIPVTLEISEVRRRQDEMERGFTRMVQSAGSAAGIGFGRAASGALAVFGATFGQRAAADLGTLRNGGAVGDASQNFSNMLGLGGAARRTNAVEMARERTAEAVGISGATMSPEALRSIFRVFHGLSNRQVQARENIRSATELEASKASEVDDGPLYRLLSPLAAGISDLTTTLKGLFTSAGGAGRR